MVRYKLTLSYVGSAYAGFQSQINALAIQDVIEEKLKVIFKDDIRLTMSSRTDAGVHALCQVIHFDHEKELDPYRLKGSLNALLPTDIHVNKVELTDESFHARFSVKRKTYVYLINLGERDPFLENRAYQCFYKLDLEKMRECAELFVGEHDFTSFNTSPLDLYPDQVREIYELKLIEEGNLLKIRITGDGFLKNMVRIIVGTLVDLGRGQKSLDEVKEMFEHPAKTKRRYNISPSGLYLVNIEY